MKVNKYILLFCLLACSWNICGQNSCFHIVGTVDSKYNGALVTLFTITGNVIRSVDSTYVENGCFGFVGPEYLYEKSIGEFYQFNLSSCIRQQNSLTAQFVSFSLANLANIFYPPDFYNN